MIVPLDHEARVSGTAVRPINASSRCLAPLAQPGHFGIFVAYPLPYTSCGVSGSPPSAGTNAQCGRNSLYRVRNTAMQSRA